MLFELNPALDRAALAARFARDGRIQVRDALTPAAAETLHEVLERATPWGLAWQAGAEGPHGLRAEAMTREVVVDASRKLDAAMRGRDYAFAYRQYKILDAYLGQWAPGGPHDLLLEHLNAPDTLDFVRAVTGIAELAKADAQATLFAPGQFLGLHDDLGKAEEHRRVAYVLSLCKPDWRPDWGGYLLFYDEDGDVTAGYRPRFNALNLFTVGAAHNVSFVPPFAPAGRFAITGWFRDA